MVPGTVPDSVAVSVTPESGAVPEFGIATRLTESAGMLDTVRVNEVVRVSAPAVAVMRTVYGPTGVEGWVARVRVLMQVGVHDIGENKALAPEGRPDAASAMDWLAPDTRDPVTVLVTVCPWVTDFDPPLEREKSNAAVAVWVVAETAVDWADVLPAAS